MTDQAWMTIRYLLIAGGAFLAGKGYVTMDQVTDFIDKIPTFVAAATAIGTAGWGLYVKWNTRSVPAVTAARVDVPTINPATGATIPGTQGK
jgi:hypothetical protein